MAIDPIVAEVRRAREAYAKQFNYDVYAMGRDLQERQQKSGRTVVALLPKRIEPIESDPTIRRREAPNPYEDPGCQETNSP
jgi:hypothetical protein